MINIPYYSNTIPLVFASNDYFVPYMAVTMQSIMENADEKLQYHFFVLYQNITNSTMDVLRDQISRYKQFKIDYIDVTPYFKNVNLFIGNRSDITIETYFRLVIPSLFCQYEKVVYLDGDMICRIDIAELYNIDIGNNWIASTRDILGIGTYYRYGSNTFDKDPYLFDGLAALKNHNNYFLGGLLVFNIKQWTIPLEELLDLAASRQWVVHDQDVLNVLCEEKTYFLPLEYQFTDFSQEDQFSYCIQYLPAHIKQEYFNAQKSPKLIHFNTSPRKPWNIPYYTPYFELFWGYALMTPFLDVIISRMKEKDLIGKNYLEKIQSLTYDKGLKNGLFIPVLRSCFLFPWYIYKIFCMVYNKPLPKKSIQLLFRSCLFFPYYVLKIYFILLERPHVLEIKDTFVDNQLEKRILTRGKMDYYDGIVSVIIPVYNGGGYLKKLIPELKAQIKIREIEIIVIDSGSTDGSVEFLKKQKINLTEIPNSDFSHSKTRNLGAKKASGDILLFMTQDALPQGKDWIFKMTLPLVEYGAVASSCIEQVRENSSSFTRLANAGYREYYGEGEGDRLTEFPGKGGFFTLRRNALLNNIASAVKKDVFNAFLYRGDFAEDLDLGIRLLQAGYKLALLSSIQVIHSHERPCSYYFRLAYVDRKTNKNIVPNFPGTARSLKEIAASTFYAYYSLQTLFTYIQSLQGDLETTGFFDFTKYYWNHSIGREPIDRNKLVFGSWYSEPEVDDFLQMVLNLYPNLNLNGNCYDDQLKYYFDVRLRNYISKNFKKIDVGLKKQIIDALFKDYLAMPAGDLALYFCEHPDKDNPLFWALENMSRGI
ncbi:glycosyltransferase [Breznakiellaceae bacterium SP9]